jgi:hypothetical protein
MCTPSKDLIKHGNELTYVLQIVLYYPYNFLMSCYQCSNFLDLSDMTHPSNSNKELAKD